MKDNDLISRAEAIDAIVGVTAFPNAHYIKSLCENPAINEDWLGGVCDAINAVEEVNAVDTISVVHARWKDNGNKTVSCSRCATWFPKEREPYLLYCGYCGARMDNEWRI